MDHFRTITTGPLQEPYTGNYRSCLQITTARAARTRTLRKTPCLRATPGDSTSTAGDTRYLPSSHSPELPVYYYYWWLLESGPLSWITEWGQVGSHLPFTFHHSSAQLQLQHWSWGHWGGPTWDATMSHRSEDYTLQEKQWNTAQLQTIQDELHHRLCEIS